MLALPLSSHRNERPQTAFAQIESEPEQSAKMRREQNVAEQWVTHPQVGSYSATQLAGQQDRAENRGLQNHIQSSATQENDSEGHRKPQGHPTWANASKTVAGAGFMNFITISKTRKSTAKPLITRSAHCAFSETGAL